MLKKINSVLSWVLTACLTAHLLTMSYSMLTGWYNYGICKAQAHATAILMALHVTISIIIIFFFHDGSGMRYGRMNLRTIIQRVTAIITAALVHIHVKAFGFIVDGEALSLPDKSGILITEILFFGALLLHLSVSFSRSLISMGLIRTEKAEKLADRIASVVCILFMIIITLALVIFVVNWSVV